jgi:hypothetical protein
MYSEPFRLHATSGWVADYNRSMRKPLAILSYFLVVLAGCQRPPERLRHEVYVWQRQWTPTVTTAMDQGAATFSAYRLLAAESDRDGSLVRITPDLAAVSHAQRPVSAVLRLNGSDPPADSQALAARVAEIVRDWRAAGIRLRGIEIDHDCATAHLSDYAQLLHKLRAAWPADEKLSITALPAWMESPELPQLLAEVDETVLQVHAVQSPQAGLFDAAAARRWIDSYATLSSKLFRVALPAYGVRVGFDAAGKAAAVVAEMPRDLAVDDVRELRASPEQVSDLLRGLERARPPQLAGVVWFRLPLADDRRAWSLATLHAVIAGESLKPVVKVSFDVDANGAHDLLFANVGEVDAPLPARIVVAARGCDAGDALEGFRLERMGDDWRFVATSDNMIRAGRERRVGWLRCDVVQGVKIDEGTQ